MKNEHPAAPVSQAEFGRRLLDAHQVAEIIGMTVDYVYALCRHDDIPHLRFGRTVRFRLSDIDRWLEDRLRGSVT